VFSHYDDEHLVAADSESKSSSLVLCDKWCKLVV